MFNKAHKAAVWKMIWGGETEVETSQKLLQNVKRWYIYHNLFFFQMVRKVTRQGSSGCK